jgi:hypothetical protein
MGDNKDKQIQPLSKDPLANLSIEDLEERLEMQMLVFSMVHSDWKCGTFSCGSFSTCTVNCGTFR